MNFLCVLLVISNVIFFHFLILLKLPTVEAINVPM